MNLSTRLPALAALVLAAAASSAQAGGLLLSDRDRGLAISPWNGSQLRLRSGCRTDDRSCTWSYRGGMLVNDASGLMLRPDGAPAHGVQLILGSCAQGESACTWIYQNGMFVNGANRSVAINAWGGARNSTPLRLHGGCQSNNPDCTWAR